jgi:hypothetical protein
MARRPAFAKAFIGRWRIVEMDQWDNDYLDLVEPAFISFGIDDGAFVFGAVKGWLDVRYGTRDGSACAEFSWEGMGSVSNFVREVGFVHQTWNLSPKMMANWVLASNHSRGGRFHCSAA